MKLPKNDNSYDQDNDEMEAFTRQREYEELTRENRPKPNPIVNCVVTMVAYVQFFWIHHQAEFVLALILFGAVTLALTGTIEAYEVGKHRHQRKWHSIKHDYSKISSSIELKMGQIDHWCLDGGDSACPLCDDPTRPVFRLNTHGWGKALGMNIQDAKVHADSAIVANKNLDVVFLGDQNTEARAGRFYGHTGSVPTKKKDEKRLQPDDSNWAGANLEELLAKSKKKFDKYFKKSEGATINGLALGIAGDTSPNLLWRIQQNEMRSLTPKIWWVEIGINDLVTTSCSEELTLMGILRVVEELLNKHDDATIVISSIIPTATSSKLQLEGKYAHNNLWPAIKLVNSRLQVFAQNHPGVKFFDAHDILTDQRGKNLYMNKNAFEDKFHLSAAGQGLLVEAQAGVVTNILKKRAEKGTSSSYRDTNKAAPSANNEVHTTFELKEEEFLEGEDDLYGYPMEEYYDQFGIGRDGYV